MRMFWPPNKLNSNVLSVGGEHNFFVSININNFMCFRKTARNERLIVRRKSIEIRLSDRTAIVITQSTEYFQVILVKQFLQHIYTFHKS